MSSSRQVSDDKSRGGKAIENSKKFAQTCSLLSRHIKGKGSIRDLNIEIDGRIQSLESIAKQSSTANSASTSVNSLTNTDKPASEHMRIEEGAKITSQLTIFYSGRVLVFDDYPADNIREMVSFARKRSSQMSYGNFHSNNNNNIQENRTNEGFESYSRAEEEEVSPQLEEASGSDLSIARRSSLHRFLEKRKDRAVGTGRGPYTMHDDEQPAKSYQHFDLNL